MKLLITGGYGFLGSHITELFFKEGHDIYVIDNLSSGIKENLPNVKHSFYNLDVTDKKCEEIFANTSIDIVVHLASQSKNFDDNLDPYGKLESDVLGLFNMLTLSKKYNVKKFILASSSTIYGNCTSFPVDEEAICNPLSLYGMNMLTKENYCILFNKLYDLDTVILRFSHIYGPRQTKENKNNIIASIMDQIITEGNVIIQDDASTLHDFIYVDDAAYAIYKATQYTQSNIYNISSNNPISTKGLFDILTTDIPSLNVNLLPPKNEVICEPILSNKRAIKELFWSPIYDMHKGLSLTYKWYLDNKSAHLEKQKEYQNDTLNGKKNYKKALPYLENILVFIIIVFLNQMLMKNQMEFPLDLKLVYIILFAVVYGLKHSSISIALSCILFLWQKYSIGEGLISMLYNVDTLIHIAIYIFTGTILSYIIEDKKNEVQNIKEEMNEIKKKFDFMYQLNNENKIIIKEFQDQILQSEDSFVKIYQIIDSLKSLEPKEIFNAAINVIEKIMKSDDVLIYNVSKNGYYMRLIAYSAQSNLENIKKSIKIEDHPQLHSVLNLKKIYINREFNSELPMMISPVSINNTLLSVIAINNVEFESLSLYKQNLFQVLTNLITSSLERAYQYESAIAKEKYLDEMYVLKEKYFAQMLQSVNISKEKSIIDYTLLMILDDQWEKNSIVNKLQDNLREFDVMGVNNQNKLFIILYNTSKEESEFVVQRLNRINIESKLVNEEQFYGNLSINSYTT